MHRTTTVLAAALASLPLASAPARADDDSNTFVQAALGFGRSSPLAGMTLGGDSELEPTGLFAASYGVSKRWSWLIPSLAFAYRGGELGKHEWIPFFGLTSWGVGFSSIEGTILQGELGAGIGFREFLGEASSVNLTGRITSPMRWASEPSLENRGPDSWQGRVSLGVSHSLGPRLQLNMAASASQWLLRDGSIAGGATERRTELAIGSVQAIGFRRLPLVSVQASERVSIDGYATLSVELESEELEQTYLGGATWAW